MRRGRRTPAGHRPPGTAKSLAVRAISKQFGGSYFEYLLGRFSEPNEVFGPIDLRRLREGVVQVQTAGMLPDADVAFLDEVFLGSTAILNTLLGILNEGAYRRGATVHRCPLRVCVGATNTLPEDPTLAAFADRFLARVFVDPVPDSRIEDLLADGWTPHPDDETTSTPETGETGSATTVMESLDRLRAVAWRTGMDDIRPALATAVRRLRSAGVPLTDRRAVRTQRLVVAAAVLAGRDRATAEDLWVLPLTAPTLDAQRLTQDLLADLIAQAGNTVLPNAAEQLSRGRAARAGRLAAAGARLTAELSDSRLGPDDRLRVEAVLREIDAGFDPDDLPPSLLQTRTALIGLLT